MIRPLRRPVTGPRGACILVHGPEQPARSREPLRRGSCAFRSEPREVLGKKLIFVCGASRSGTSMMGSLLGLNDEVRRLPELHFFEEISTEAERAKPLDKAKAVDLVNRLLWRHRYKSTRKIDSSSDEFRGRAEDIVKTLPEGPSAELVFAAFLAYICALRGKPIPCDHTPRNVYYLREILGAYPNARVDRDGARPARRAVLPEAPLEDAPRGLQPAAPQRDAAPAGELPPGHDEPVGSRRSTPATASRATRGCTSCASRTCWLTASARCGACATSSA